MSSKNSGLIWFSSKSDKFYKSCSDSTGLTIVVQYKFLK